MSKQGDAKEKQGYTTNRMSCGNCTHLTFDLDLPTWMKLENQESKDSGLKVRYGDEHKERKNIRCGIGDFAVQRTAYCTLWVSVGKEKTNE